MKKTESFYTAKIRSIESLRAFALSHNEVAFAHLCTDALTGEEWAVDRVTPALFELPLWSNNKQHELTLRHVISATDTTRPDGAVARKIEV